MQTEVILGIGGNKGDRSSYLARAREALSREVMLVSSSQVYETEAWGGVAEKWEFFESGASHSYQFRAFSFVKTDSGYRTCAGTNSRTALGRPHH